MNELLEQLPERAIVVKVLQNNSWDQDKPKGKWLAAILGSEDYVCMGDSFIETDLRDAVYADTAEAAARGLLEKLKGDNAGLPM